MHNVPALCIRVSKEIFHFLRVSTLTLHKAQSTDPTFVHTVMLGLLDILSSLVHTVQ